MRGTGGSVMDEPDELRSLARKCRVLAAGISDEETRKSLELLARDYETRANEIEAVPNRPEMPRPE